MAANEVGRRKWDGMRLNNAHPLVQHLWGCWMMDGYDDKLGARLRDLSWNQNHGTWDGASGAADYVDGPLGRELQFDNGTTEQILLDKACDEGGLPRGENELCVESWIRFGGPTSATEFDWFSSWTSPHALKCGYDSTGNRIEFFIGTSTGLKGFVTTIDIDDGLYHHVICQYSAIAGRLEVWVDGQFQQSTAHTGTLFPTATAPIYVGAANNNDDLWDGRISFVRTYNRFFGHDTISRLYAFPFEMFVPQTSIHDDQFIVLPPANDCILSATADAVGPTVPDVIQKIDGRIPAEV